MRYWTNRFLVFLLWLLIRLRYKVRVKGLENIKQGEMERSGGILFLPNHPTVFIDPLLVSAYTMGKFCTRAMITEYMYFAPGVYRVMQWINALPVPALTNSPNSFKKYRNQQSFDAVAEGLRKGNNFLIYPAGRTKSSGLEIVGGASGVHAILQQVPQTNIVLVRMTGLWGSVFSRAITGQAPQLWPTIWFAVKAALKAGVFFLPRRKVTLEFETAPAGFPYGADRVTFNRWLEQWYNAPYQERLEKGEAAGEPLTQVSYSPFKYEVPTIFDREERDDQIDLDKVDPEVRDQLLTQLAHMTKRPVSSLTPELDLARDLGLDSLDGAELIAFMEESLGVHRVHPEDLTTVRQLLGLVSGQVKVEHAVEEEAHESASEKWRSSGPLLPMQLAEGKTVGEVFLRSCDRQPKAMAVADPRGGVLTYRDLKMRALLLAEVIRDLPGERIGIMLPASAGATLLVLACHLAKKVPVMVNWTVGKRHLDTVVELSGIEVVLTAWAFVDRLDNADLTPIHDRILLLEEVAFKIGLGAKVRAALSARVSADTLIRRLRLDEVNPETAAGILFTSGTEKAPKAVPLTHFNIVENLRCTMKIAPFDESDVVLAMLPPFHSFGFTLTGLLPLLCGVRVAFSPDPTDGPRLARDIHRWSVSMLAGAPTFLKGVLKAGSAEQLASLRSVLSGAERVSPEVIALTKGLKQEVNFAEGYGITECSPVVTVQRLPEGDTGVGQAIPGVDLMVVHPESHQEMPVGEQGLILIHGPNVFGGYIGGKEIGDPFLEIEGKRWYVSGDLGNLDEARCLHISGRLKRFVKIGGEMVSLTAIESALMEVAPSMGWPEPEEGPTVAVTAKEHADSKTELFLFTRFKTSLPEVNRLLKEQGFSNLVKVTELFVIPEIPITGTGKTNYRRLESTYLSDRS